MLDLLICIAHHHQAPDRLQYLQRILKCFRDEYALDYNIVIDSNAELPEFTRENVRVVHHANLEHPFNLTWQHRKHMRAEIDNYHWFMYIEDDLLLPFANFQNYQENFRLLWPNCVPSFLRVETFEGAEFALDVTVPQEYKPIQTGKRSFATLTQPYHGLWCMPQRELKENMAPEFDRVSDSREVAASFPMWELGKTPLIELDGKQISRKCFAYHLPNNYAPCKSSPHAKIRIDDVFCT